MVNLIIGAILGLIFTISVEAALVYLIIIRDRRDIQDGIEQDVQ